MNAKEKIEKLRTLLELDFKSANKTIIQNFIDNLQQFKNEAAIITRIQKDIKKQNWNSLKEAQAKIQFYKDELKLLIQYMDKFTFHEDAGTVLDLNKYLVSTPNRLNEIYIYKPTQKTKLHATSNSKTILTNCKYWLGQVIDENENEIQVEVRSFHLVSNSSEYSQLKQASKNIIFNY